MRELNVVEMDSVAGGWDVVGAKTTSPQWSGGIGMSPDTDFSSLFIDLDRVAELFGAKSSGNLVDTDGDGVPDSPEITVVANKVSLPGNYYAYISNGQYIMHYDGWVSNPYVGTYVPGTEDNHNLVTKDSSWSFSLKTVVRGAPVEGQISENPNSAQYWLAVQ